MGDKERKHGLYFLLEKSYEYLQINRKPGQIEATDFSQCSILGTVKKHINLKNKNVKMDSTNWVMMQPT
jgi:phage anti-repressor protein